MLLTAQPLHPSQSPVVFLRVLSFHLLPFFSIKMIFFMPLPLMFTPLPMIQPYINLLPSSASLPLMLSQSRLAMSSNINSDLQSISEWEPVILVKFNTSKTQLLTISLFNTPSNYPIIFEDSEIASLNSINILGFQISSSLSWRDHIVQIAKSA